MVANGNANKTQTGTKTENKSLKLKEKNALIVGSNPTLSVPKHPEMVERKSILQPFQTHLFNLLFYLSDLSNKKNEQNTNNQKTATGLLPLCRLIEMIK